MVSRRSRWRSRDISRATPTARQPIAFNTSRSVRASTSAFASVEARGRIGGCQIAIDTRSKPFAYATDVECDGGNAKRGGFKSDKAEWLGPGARQRQQRRRPQCRPPIVPDQPSRGGTGHVSIRCAPLPRRALGAVPNQQQPNRAAQPARGFRKRIHEKRATFQHRHASKKRD